MYHGTDLIYRYDGTLDGFLCCVFESMSAREQPLMVLSQCEMQSILFADKPIETDRDIARRVANAIRGKISDDALEFTAKVLMTALPGREALLLELIRRLFKAGPGLLQDLTDPTVNKLMKAVTHLEREAHLYTGFVRFQAQDGVLTAIIEPKNQVLSLILPHFSDRFAGETFLIYDKTHRAALIHRAETEHSRGASTIVPLEDLQRPPADEQERAFRALWQRFYRTIAIEGRENPTCQRGHLPLRYRSQMTEHEVDSLGETRTPLPVSALPAAAHG